MNAVVINRYGPPDVLEYTTLARPDVTDHDLLIRVYATSVNPVECALRQGKLRPFVRVRFPFVLGVDLTSDRSRRKMVVGMVSFAANLRDKKAKPPGGESPSGL